MANVSGVQIDVYNIKSWVCWWAKAMTTAITINSRKNLKGIWQHEQKPQVKVEQEASIHIHTRTSAQLMKENKAKKNDVPIISMWWLMRIWLLLILNAAVVALYCWWHLIWPFARCQPLNALNGLIFTTYNKSIDTRLLFTYFCPFSSSLFSRPFVRSLSLFAQQQP